MIHYNQQSRDRKGAGARAAPRSPEGKRPCGGTRSLTVAALLLVPLWLTAQETLRVTVRLVNVTATVRGPDGQLARALTREDFEVLDEGQAQAIRVFAREAEVPLSIALLLDISGSTAKDLKFEQDSASRFARSILREQDRIALFPFNDEVTQATAFTSSAIRLEQVLRSVRPGGGTSLFDAIFLAAEQLRKQQGRKVMILVTDGGDTTSHIGFKEALRAAQEADAVLYSIIVVPIRSDAGRDTAGEHALQLLSEGTGGRFYTPENAAQFDPVFAGIADELHTQYVLGFYADPNLAAGGYRRLQVRVLSPGFTVQARKGYYLRDR